MGKKHRIVIAITVFVLVVSAAVVAAYLVGSQKPKTQPPPFLGESTVDLLPTQITEWETYTNTKYSYSIDYPEGWATIINITGGGKKETLDNADSLDIFDSASQKSYPEAVMTITRREAPSSLPDGWNESESTINGIQVKKIEGDEEGLHKETYILPSDKGVIEIEVRYAVGDPVKQTFDEMLSTFQLTQ